MPIFKSRRGRRNETIGEDDWVDDDVVAAMLDYEYRLSSLRLAMFDYNVINDASWPLVQRLFSAHLKGTKMRTKELYVDTGLAQTTVLRYLDHLEKCDVVRRENDPLDHRATLVMITDAAAAWVREYYSQMHKGEQELAVSGQGMRALGGGRARV